MRKIINILNGMIFLIGAIWLFKSGYDYEPLIVLLSTLTAFVANNQNANFSVVETDEKFKKYLQYIAMFFVASGMLIFVFYFSAESYSKNESSFIRIGHYLIKFLNFFISLSLITSFAYLGVNVKVFNKHFDGEIDEFTIAMFVNLFLAFLAVTFFLETNFSWLIARLTSLMYYLIFVILIVVIIYQIRGREKWDKRKIVIKLLARIFLIMSFTFFILKILEHPIGEEIVGRIDRDMQNIYYSMRSLILFFTS